MAPPILLNILAIGVCIFVWVGILRRRDQTQYQRLRRYVQMLTGANLPQGNLMSIEAMETLFHWVQLQEENTNLRIARNEARRSVERMLSNPPLR